MQILEIFWKEVKCKMYKKCIKMYFWYKTVFLISAIQLQPTCQQYTVYWIQTDRQTTGCVGLGQAGQIWKNIRSI